MVLPELRPIGNKATTSNFFFGNKIGHIETNKRLNFSYIDMYSVLPKDCNFIKWSWYLLIKASLNAPFVPDLFTKIVLSDI